jgi:RNA polymerase sigma-70 factor (ECF subfamily)
MTAEEKHVVEALIAQVALGDRKAFSRLYDVTSGKLLAICLRALKDHADAENAMQVAYVNVWKNAARYRVTGHSPMTWLITIARNTAIDHLRMGRPDRKITDIDDRIAATGPTPEQAAVAASESLRIKRCMDELDQDRRDAIIGAYLDGRTYQDLSEQFEVPLNTMRTWLRRGLIALRECLSR